MKKLLLILALIPSLGMAQRTTVRATKSTGVLLTPSNFFTGNAISTTTFAEDAATNAYNWAVLDAPGSGGGGIFSTSSGGNVATSTNDLVLISGSGLSANQLQFAVSNSTGRVLSVDKEGDIIMSGSGAIYIAGPGKSAKIVGDVGNDSIEMQNNVSYVRLLGNAATIFNLANQATADFRIRGDIGNNFFFADVSTEFIGINEATPEVELDVNGTIQAQSQPGGTLSVSNSTTTISVDNTAYVMLTNWDRNDEFSNMTAETGNDSMTATIAGTYLVTVSMDFNGCDNDYYHVAVFKEGAIVPYATANQSPPGTNAKMSVGITSLITLAIGDTLDVRMIRDGAGSPSSPVLRAGTFTAIKVR